MPTHRYPLDAGGWPRSTISQYGRTLSTACAHKTATHVGRPTMRRMAKVHNRARIWSDRDFLGFLSLATTGSLRKPNIHFFIFLQGRQMVVPKKQHAYTFLSTFVPILRSSEKGTAGKVGGGAKIAEIVPHPRVSPRLFVSVSLALRKVTP